MNCLVTKLKEEVNTSVEKYLGYVRVDLFVVSGEALIRFDNENLIDVFTNDTRLLLKKVNGEYSSNLVGTTSPFYVKNTTSEGITTSIFISNKYTLRAIEISNYTAGNRILTYGFKGDDYCGITSTYYNQPSQSFKGNVADLYGFALEYCGVEQVLTNFYVNNFSKFPTLKNIAISGGYYVGSIENITCPLLENLAFGQATNVGGTIEKLIATQRWISGRNTGSITGNSSNHSRVTFNGTTGAAVRGYSWEPDPQNNEHTIITSVDGVVVIIDKDGNPV